ncbi:MAG TPA: type II CAAX endopeptidase family protein [Gemmatimonadales bacterium]|nr:type II CAAX endopeptidase family protein [Gemmatimonadales bacterium]
MPDAEGPAAASPRDGFAAQLRGFGPTGVVALLAILLSGTPSVGRVAVPLGALLVLAWARRSGTPWNEIGYVPPKSWIASIAIGLAVGVPFKFLMKAVVMPLLGANPINRTYHYLAGNRAILPAAVWAMLVAGFGEETVFRGYLFERLGKLIAARPGAKAAILLLTSGLFALAHYPDQGLAGAEQAMCTGLVFGTIFIVTGQIWIPMIAHAAYDLTALAMIYGNVESAVAHWVFK